MKFHWNPVLVWTHIHHQHTVQAALCCWSRWWRRRRLRLHPRVSLPLSLGRRHRSEGPPGEHGTGRGHREGHFLKRSLAVNLRGLAAAAPGAAVRRLGPLWREAVGPLPGLLRWRDVGGGVGLRRVGVRSSRRSRRREQGVVGRTPAVELLPLGRRRSGRRRRLLPVLPGVAGGDTAASSFLHLAQGLTGRRGDGRRPAVAVVEAEVVLRHGSSSERQRGWRRGEGGSVVVITAAAAAGLSGAPPTLMEVVLTDAL